MDTLDPNNLSEIESLSDSDWLDISSRASEDTDSVAGFDSDREDANIRSHSRLSSVNSSHGGDVQGWEGVVEDSSDEAVAAQTTDVLPLSHRSMSLANAAVTFEAQEEDPEEEQRVKDALDQSMMSTLSSSRSNSLNASIQTSIVHSRDMRLSFPDPLTSPRDELLNTSYEDVFAPADVSQGSSGAEEDTQPPIDNGTAPTAADPGELTMPAVPQEDQIIVSQAKPSPDFYLVLYGVSTSLKWAMVDKLLEKIAQGASITLSSEVSEPEITFPHFTFTPLGESRGERVVSIVDRTELLDGGEKPSYTSLDRPSLAIVYLPASIVSLPAHTLYLPLLAQNLSFVDLPYSSDQLLDAEQQWEMCLVPRKKVLRFSRHSSLVVEADEVDRVKPAHVARALRPLLGTRTRTVVHTIRSAHAFTILAVLSIVLGCVLKGSFQPPTSVVKPALQEQQTFPFWSILRPATAPQTLSTANASNALAPSSLKDFALAVLYPASVATTSATRLSATPAPSASHAALTDAPSECSCGCGLITWPGKSETAGSSLRPTPAAAPNHAEDSKTSLALIAGSPSGKGKGKALVDDVVYELSTRMVGALAEYFDVGVIVQAVQKDLQELYDALDALVYAIGKQTAAVWTRWNWRDTAVALRKEVEYRNKRAHSRAQELKALGGRLFMSVRERVHERAGRASKNARVLRESTALDAYVWGPPKERREEATKVRRMGRERRLQRMRRAFTQ